MKPRNFPARKEQRREAALRREGRTKPTGIFSRDMPVTQREVRTKKYRGAA